MSTDTLTMSLILLGFGGMVGLIGWLIKGRLDKSDDDLRCLKKSVVYEDTCEAHRDAQAQGMQMVATSIQSMLVAQQEQGKVLGVLATDLAVVKNSIKPREA